MKKPLCTNCPICGKPCLISEPHEEVYTKRKEWLYIHLFCLKGKEHETVMEKI